MDKITYLAELAEGLARWVPERERQDILRYYAEYFEEAGQDREAEVIAELGDPWALSCRLAVEGGYVTHEKAASWRPQKTWRRALIGTAVGLTIFTLVFGFGLLAINVVRTAGGVVKKVVGIGTEVLFENVTFAEDPGGAMGFYLLDGERVDSFQSIDADISFGDIQVVAGDDFTLSVDRSEAVTGYEPVLEIKDGVLRLRDGSSPRVDVDSWNDLKDLFGVGKGAMDVTITVPAGMMLDSISVKTGLGDVTLWGVCAKTVTAETGMGDVECYEAREVRKMELTTGMGDVNLGMGEACDGLNVGLKTGMGDIEATLCGNEKDYYYELESGLGSVTVNGAGRGGKVERRGSAPYTLRAETGMGDVGVWFTFD